MNGTEDKRLNDLIDKIMEETSLDTPSIDFTSNIMTKVELIANTNVTTYRPLISKQVWFGVLILIIGAMVYPLFYSTTETSWLTNMDFNKFSYHIIVSRLSNLAFSKIMIYSVVIFALMFAVQSSLLKVYFNKRLS